MATELETDIRQLDTLRRRLQALEARYAELGDPSSAEARDIEQALASARASLELAYGNLPPGLARKGEERSH
jgi:hypothetical protein